MSTYGWPTQKIKNKNLAEIGLLLSVDPPKKYHGEILYMPCLKTLEVVWIHLTMAADFENHPQVWNFSLVGITLLFERKKLISTRSAYLFYVFCHSVFE